MFKNVIPIACCALLALPLLAHDVFIQVSPLPETGEVRIRPFFDDGSDAVGDEVVLADPATREEVARHRIPASGIAVIPHPTNDVLVIYSGVPGHRAEVRLRGDPDAAAAFTRQTSEVAPPPSPTAPRPAAAPAIPDAVNSGSLWPWLLVLALIGIGGAALHRRYRQSGDH